MPMQLFKSKKASKAKGKTIKKPEPTDDRPSAPTPDQSGFPGIDDDEFILDGKMAAFHDRQMAAAGKDDDRSDGLVAAKEWIREGMRGKPKRAQRRISVMERTMADPYHAGLVNSADSEVNNEGEAETQGLPELQPSTTESSADADTPSRTEPPIMNLLLGQQDPTSPYFTRRYLQASNNGTLFGATSSTLASDSEARYQDDTLFSCSGIDPHAFELYRIWLDTGTLPTIHRDVCCDLMETNPSYTWYACWPLMNAVILGYKTNAIDFTDRVMDMLDDKVVKGVCADADTVIHLFGEEVEGIPDVLKRFVIDRWINAGIDGWEDVDLSSQPPAFVQRMLEAALRRLTHVGQIPLVPGCEYHTHKTLESCYRRRLTPSEVRKNERLEYHREMSRKDSEEVETNVRLNDVKSIDWEKRKARATRAVREQTGRTLRGLMRSEIMRPELDEVVSSGNPSLTNRGLPSAEVTPDARQATAPAADIFGMTQTPEAADRIKGKLKPPSRAPPPPPSPPPPTPAPIELKGSAAYVMQHLGTLPPYQHEPTMPIDGGLQVDLGDSDSISPHLGIQSTESKPDSRLSECLEGKLEFEKHASCPGAFPDSRAGSFRNVTLRE